MHIPHEGTRHKLLVVVLDEPSGSLHASRQHAKLWRPSTPPSAGRTQRAFFSHSTPDPLNNTHLLVYLSLFLTQVLGYCPSRPCVDSQRDESLSDARACAETILKLIDTPMTSTGETWLAELSKTINEEAKTIFLRVAAGYLNRTSSLNTRKKRDSGEGFEGGKSTKRVREMIYETIRSIF